MTAVRCVKSARGCNIFERSTKGRSSHDGVRPGDKLIDVVATISAIVVVASGEARAFRSAFDGNVSRGWPRLVVVVVARTV